MYTYEHRQDRGGVGQPGHVHERDECGWYGRMDQQELKRISVEKRFAPVTVRIGLRIVRPATEQIIGRQRNIRVLSIQKHTVSDASHLHGVEEAVLVEVHKSLGLLLVSRRRR